MVNSEHSPLAAFSNSTTPCGLLHRRNGRLEDVSVADLLLFRALAVIRIVDAYIYMLYHPDKNRPNNWCTAHVVCDDDDNLAHAYKIHDRTMDNLWFYSPDRCARRGTLCCGTHWNVNKSNTRAFSSYRIHAKIHIDHPFCTGHATNACTQSFDRRECDGMDMTHPVDTLNHRCCWKIDIPLPLILRNERKTKRKLMKTSDQKIISVMWCDVKKKSRDW